MKNIEWIHKIHKADKNTEKVFIKEDYSMSIAFHVNLTSFLKFSCHFNEAIRTILVAQLYGHTLQLLYVKFLVLCTVWSVWWSEAKCKCTLNHLGPFLS